MKKIAMSFLVSLGLLISINGYAQEIDISVIEDLSSDQIEIAKEVLGDEIINNNKTSVERDLSQKKEESLKGNCDLDSGAGCDLENEKSSPSSSKFGYNFISTSPTSIVATGDLPLPNDYKVSLGDVIGVIMSGSKESMFDMKVQLDGTVFFPELGSVSVSGESFKDVKTKLNNLVQQTYIGVSIDLSLIELSAKKITIVGAVSNPGTYLVNPFTTISNSLAYSGGIQEIGSLRNITLIRLNGDNFKFDLYDLLIKGDRTNDITIESGDVIIVGPANKFVNITGMVKRPATYEIVAGEDLSDLLEYALGFAGGANKEKITLDKLDLDNSSIIKIITNDITHDLKNILSVNVYPLMNDTKSSILVSGAIMQPGYYELENYPNLEDLINNLDFIDVYPWLAILEQFDEKNLVKSSVLFNLNDPNTYRSIKLHPNSRIFFANINERKFATDPITRNRIGDYNLVINHKQGSFTLPVIGKYSVKSFVDLLGLDMSDVDEEATYISPLEDIVIKDNYKNMQFFANKYNTVSFRSPVNNLITVSITGAIDYPGTYTLQSNSTIQDLYGMIGSFKNEAFLDGIIFTRESIRERQINSISRSQEDLNKALLARTQRGDNIGNIDLIISLSKSIEPENLGRIAGNFSPGSSSAKNTILANGDSIIIPNNPNAINVLGEVINPIAFEYSDRLNIRSAIEGAGGYQNFADKRKVYVIKANGMIERANRNIFVKNIDLEPGDTIVVPRKIITNNPGIDALVPITNILSDLAFSAAALETLSNNK